MKRLQSELHARFWFRLFFWSMIRWILWQSLKLCLQSHCLHLFLWWTNYCHCSVARTAGCQLELKSNYWQMKSVLSCVCACVYMSGTEPGPEYYICHPNAVTTAHVWCCILCNSARTSAPPWLQDCLWMNIRYCASVLSDVFMCVNDICNIFTCAYQHVCRCVCSCVCVCSLCFPFVWQTDICTDGAWTHISVHTFNTDIISALKNTWHKCRKNVKSNVLTLCLKVSKAAQLHQRYLK